MTIPGMLLLCLNRLTALIFYMSYETVGTFCENNIRNLVLVKMDSIRSDFCVRSLVYIEFRRFNVSIYLRHYRKRWL
jgi:hypothetical protein